MAKHITLKTGLLTLLFTTLLNSQIAHAAGGAQSNFNLGMDMPASAAKYATDYYLVRFQLERVEVLFSPRFSFTLDLGSGLTGGEINGGIAIYPVYKSRSELPVQPFVGLDGGAFLGSRDKVVSLSPGITVVGGADIRIVKKLGVTLESDYLIYANQVSARLWVGLTYTSL